MTTGEDPCGAHRFRVVCDVLPDIGFTEVRGLSVAVVGREREDETPPRREWRVPRGLFDPPDGAPPVGRRECRSPTLELRRGVTTDQSLWTWLREWVAGDVDPQDVRICLLDAGGDPVRGWVCREATPVRWTGPELVADRARVATETLELAHEGIDAVTDLEECTA